MMANISDELIAAAASASTEYGIPTSVILGFAGAETTFGTAGTAVSKNNLFGVMNADGTAKTYDNIYDSVMDFASLVTGNKNSAQSKIYGNATEKCSTDDEWVYAIVGAGYNSEYENNEYEQNVLTLIESNNLNQYNNHQTDNSNGTLISNIIRFISFIGLIIIGTYFLVLGVKSNGNR